MHYHTTTLLSEWPSDTAVSSYLCYETSFVRRRIKAATVRVVVATSLDWKTTKHKQNARTVMIVSIRMTSTVRIQTRTVIIVTIKKTMTASP